MTFFWISSKGLWDFTATDAPACAVATIWRVPRYRHVRAWRVSHRAIIIRAHRAPWPTVTHHRPVSMPSRTRLITAALATGFITSLSCMRATANAEGAPLTSTVLAPPKLVVFITVDQLRGDMLDRYRNDLRYGCARLARGAWFTRGVEGPAITDTAAGRSSIMPGPFPRSTRGAPKLPRLLDPDFERPAR